MRARYPCSEMKLEKEEIAYGLQVNLCPSTVVSPDGCVDLVVSVSSNEMATF